MADEKRPILIAFDDRDTTGSGLATFVGERRFGDIIYRRRSLYTYLRDHLPAWARDNFHHLRHPQDLVLLRKVMEASADDMSLFIISSRAGIADYERLTQLLERLPYAEENFVDRRYKPLLAFYCNGHGFLSRWDDFVASPVHHWDDPLMEHERVTSVSPLDLSRVRDFLLYMCGATETRHFNRVEIDDYFYTKRSADKAKMNAEYSFYNLVPEAMRSWLVQPFDYRDEGETASYRMMRYYIADASLQWVHGAFTQESFEAFVDRVLFFVGQRPGKPVQRSVSAELARQLFVNKVEQRILQLLDNPEGRRLNDMLAISDPALDLRQQLERYKALFQKYQKQLTAPELAVGHGDPCFSNMLYDQERHLLKLIDPKGAAVEADIWTHPLYDLCKISHSVLGDYDFINNGLYDLTLDDSNSFRLMLREYRHDSFKDLFLQKLAAQGYDWRVVRLTEASLFLSMLPLHIDYPSKVTAFALIAHRILDRVEYD